MDMEFTNGKRTGVIFSLSPTIEREMTGWTCRRPVMPIGQLFEPVFYNILSQEVIAVSCDVIVRQARHNGLRSGIYHAEAMRREMHKFPVEWQEYGRLIFPEIWQRHIGGRLAIFTFKYYRGLWQIDLVSPKLLVNHGMVVNAVMRLQPPHLSTSVEWTPDNPSIDQ